jgi:hypothetical protein
MSSGSGTTASDAPAILDMWLPTPKWHPDRVDPRSGLQGAPRFIVVHVQQGTSPGTWAWHALKVRASATVFVNRDGSIWRCVPEEHAPLSNGDACRSTPAGWRLRDLGGDPNIWCLTIATEGYSHAPNDAGWPVAPTTQQLRSVVWQVQDWMKRFNIPIENVIRHADLTHCTDAEYTLDTGCAGCHGGRDTCPGDAYFQLLQAELQSVVPARPVPAVPAAVSQPQWPGRAAPTASPGIRLRLDTFLRRT